MNFMYLLRKYLLRLYYILNLCIYNVYNSDFTNRRKRNLFRLEAHSYGFARIVIQLYLFNKQTNKLTSDTCHDFEILELRTKQRVCKCCRHAKKITIRKLKNFATGNPFTKLLKNSMQKLRLQVNFRSLCRVRCPNSLLYAAICVI